MAHPSQIKTVHVEQLDAELCIYDWARQEAANYQRQRDNWNRAFTACMAARGYTVG